VKICGRLVNLTITSFRNQSHPLTDGIMRNTTKLFGRLVRYFCARKPVSRLRQRPRRFEQLEKRSLLSITVGGTVTVDYSTPVASLPGTVHQYPILSRQQADGVKRTGSRTGSDLRFALCVAKCKA